MLVGLAVLITTDRVVPRDNVTILAQLTAGAFGKGVVFYVANLSVALALGLAANTSFGRLPVLMSLLAKDGRMPHLFYLRAERPIYRYGIAALALAAALLLVAVGAQTERLIPLFTIGVFIGFTISQVGLVRHWASTRPPKWRARAAINGVGATLTAIAVVVALLTKFLAGAWVVTLAIPLLIIMFARTENYYTKAGADLQLGLDPPHPTKRTAVMIISVSAVDLLTERAVTAGLSMSDRVIAVCVAGDEDERTRIKAAWVAWAPDVPLEVVIDPHRSLVRTLVKYIHGIEDDPAVISVLIPEIVPRKWRHEILHNQRGRLLASALREETSVAVTTLPFHLHD
jgi:hypothetical protein